MKKTLAVLLSSMIIFSGLTACSAKDNNTTTASGTEVKTKSEKVKVLASFYPMYDFVQKVGGDKVEAVNLVTPGMEAHDWEPTPNDMVSMNNADLIVYSGAGMEHWVKDIQKSLDNKNVKFVEASKGLTLIKNEEHEDHDEDHHDDHDADHHDDHDKDHHDDHDADHHDDHDKDHHDDHDADHHDDHDADHHDDHDKDHHDDHDADHHDEHEHHHHHHHHGEFDPHVWLSPLTAKMQMQAIKEALQEVSPENKDYFEANYKKYAAEFDKLDQEFKEKLAKTSSKTIIVAHEAFAYLCRDYGLEQEGIEGIEADAEPSPARMAELIEFAKEHKVTTIFFEELVSPKVAEAIAKEVGAKTAVLNPLEGLSVEAMQKGEDYFSVMRANLANLVEALK